MTRPLGKQINDPRTKHTRLSFTATPGSSSLVIPAATLEPLTISEIPGGAEEDIHPQVLGTNVEPFATSAGDQISVQIDNGPVVLVTFASTDISASAVVTRINTAYGAEIAFARVGKVFLRSNGVIGASGTLELHDTVGAPLAKFGFVAGIITGVDNSTRGILTLTENGLGGFTSIRLPGAQNIVTDADEFIRSSNTTSSITYNLGIPGGQPIHGRLTHVGTNYVLSYFTYLPEKSFVRTKGSNFAALDVTDSITFTVTYNDVTTATVVTFPSPPYTRDGVINRINTVWASAAYGTGGFAFIKATVSQPYDFTTETVWVSVNGAAEVAVILTSTDRTAQDVVNKFALVTGLTANVANETNGKYLTLQPTSGVGFNSTLSIRNDNAPGNNALAKLGITPGVYKGPYIARPDGIGEITITSHNRGSKSTLLVSAAVQTLTRMGLVGVTGAPASDVEVDVPVVIPDLATFGRTKGSYLIEILLPEVISFGEIPTDTTSNKEEFDNFSTGSNVDLKRDAAIFPGTQTYANAFMSVGQNAGKVVNVGPDGLIDIGHLGRVTNYVDRYFKQFLAGNFATGRVDALVASELRTPGYDGNPLAENPEFDVRIDWNDSYTSSNRSFNIIFGASSVNPTYEFRESRGTIRRAIRIGRGLDPVTENATLPRILYDLPASATTSILTSAAATSSGWGTLRDYGVTGINTFLYDRTINAAYSSGTTYNRDSTAQASVRTRDGNTSSGGFERDTFTGGSSTVTDATWIKRFRFPNTPSYPGNENEIRDMLRIGEQLLSSDTALNAMIPRIITDASNQTRTLLWESDNSYGGSIIRIYSSRYTVHSSDGAASKAGFEIVKNALWRNDLSPQVWEVDDTGSAATKLFIGDGGFHVKTTGGSPPSFFNDTDTVNGWWSGDSGGGGSSSSYGQPHTALKWRANPSGSEEVIFDFPGPIVFNNNKFDNVSYRSGALYSNLIPKICGRIFQNLGTITASSGYGVGTPILATNTIFIPWPVTPDDYNEAVIVANVSAAASNICKIIPGTGATGVTFYLLNTTTAAAINYSTVLCGIDFAVYYVAS